MTSSSDQTTLVMGARGSVGRLVLNGLIARGVPVRASVRRPQAGQLPTGIAVHAADLTDPASLAPAFDGVRQVFLYANPVGVRGVVDAARSAGIERIVLMSSGSVVHPSSAGNTITEEHREVEEAFAAADLTVVPVRPLVLATNALGWAHSVRAARTVALYRPDARTAPIHERDIADVALAALLGDDDTSGMLTGPVRTTQREQVTAVAAAVGEEIFVEELAREAALAHFSRFMPAGEAEAVLWFLDDAAAGRSPATDTVEKVLGRPATGFDVWARDHVEDFT